MAAAPRPNPAGVGVVVDPQFDGIDEKRPVVLHVHGLVGPGDQLVLVFTVVERRVGLLREESRGGDLVVGGTAAEQDQGRQRKAGNE